MARVTTQVGTPLRHQNYSLMHHYHDRLQPPATGEKQAVDGQLPSNWQIEIEIVHNPKETENAKVELTKFCLYLGSGDLPRNTEEKKTAVYFRKWEQVILFIGKQSHCRETSTSSTNHARFNGTQMVLKWISSSFLVFFLAYFPSLLDVSFPSSDASQKRGFKIKSAMLFWWFYSQKKQFGSGDYPHSYFNVF